jgi:hypothetical protein
LIPELPEYYLRELGSLVYNKQEHFEAAQGKHDDAVVSLFLGLYAAANPVRLLMASEVSGVSKPRFPR